MKHGAEFAKRVKKFFAGLKHGEEAAAPADLRDPMDQLILAILEEDSDTESAHKALAALQETMVDYNELRVSHPEEIAGLISPFVGNAGERARRIARALNAIFDRENCLSLATLLEKGRREGKQYLDTLEGVSPAVSASVVLWSLGGHSLPVDSNTVQALREESLIDASADAVEVQAFLERHIPAAEGRQFIVLMRRYISQRLAQPVGAGPSRTEARSANVGGEEQASESADGKKTAKKKTAAKSGTSASRQSGASIPRSTRGRRSGGG